MLKLAISCLALALAAAPAAAHPPDIVSAETEKIIAEEVAAFRKKVADAVTRKDAAALRGYYANSFAHTHASGKLDGKEARIASALAGEPVIENAPSEELVIRAPGGWTAVATGVSPLRSPAGGKTYAFRWTAVYVRAGETWQLAASQAARMQEIK